MLNKLVIESETHTFIDSLFLDMNFCSEKFLYIGKHNGNVVYRSLLKFELADLPHNSNIERCLLKMYIVRNDDMENDCIYSVHPITENWCAEEVTWNNQPSHNLIHIANSSIGCNYFEEISWDITNIIKEWAIKEENNYGLLIKAAQEETAQNLVGFIADKFGHTGWRPKLEISYKIVSQQTSKETKPSLAILTPQFFEWDGGRCLFGGGERYLIDFVKLVKEIGYKVEVYQPSNGNYWERIFDGITIKGIGIAGLEEDFMVEVNKAFKKYTKMVDYHLYFNMDVAYPEAAEDSICISHGIWWDTLGRSHWRTPSWYEKIFQVLNSVKLLVSVDTNTINWVNAVNPEAKCYKKYIPNYVDLEVFKPMRSRKKFIASTKHTKRKIYSKNFINILYPRRLNLSRGWSVCKEAALEMLQKYKNIKFTFVGRGSEETEKHMEIFASKHPRIEYRWYEMHDMYKAYQDADIVLIPSLHSEGTSLSLLEAMACGKPVIAGITGGLTDLIINEYNGLLIDVNKENLIEAITKLIRNPRLRKKMGFNALEVAEKFSKENWQKKWTEVLLQYFPLN